MADNLIKAALHLAGWRYGEDAEAQLREHGTLVRPEEYTPALQEQIFCTECTAPLYRSPSDRPRASNGRIAYFAHCRSHETECSLRVRRSPGWAYETEEQSRQAIERGNLVIVESFASEAPEPPERNGAGVWDHDPNEDRDGPVVHRAIGRHNGEQFELPSRIFTVRGLVRGLDRRWHAHYLLPGHVAPQPLHDLIRVSNSVRAPTDQKILIAGRITASDDRGAGRPDNLRMLWLKYVAGAGTADQEFFKDFCIKVPIGNADEKGITNASVGQVVMVYGRVTPSGMGTCVNRPGWGEFALVPPRYESLFDGL